MDQLLLVEPSAQLGRRPWTTGRNTLTTGTPYSRQRRDDSLRGLS
jgi:hypothetical protein